jgi:ATP-binding cassette subfamily F protein uup
MVILSALDVSIKFGIQVILDKANLTINHGERIGVVGKNGAGKSTLLKILSKTIAPDDGEITSRRGLQVKYVSQDCELDLSKTVIENIRDGASRIYKMLEEYESGEGDLHEMEHALTECDGWDIDNHIKIAMQELNVPPSDKLCSDLSGGEKRRVGICRAIVSRPDLLILDEPTNHLDTGSIEWLENFLKSYSGTSLFVTHDRYFLDQVATRVIDVDKGQINSYDGNYSAYLTGKAERDAKLEILEQKRKDYIRREIDWIRRGPKARGTKAKYRIQKFDEAKNAKFYSAESDVDLIIPPPPKMGNIILELNEVSMERGGKKLFDNLDFTFERGTCLGIVGKNGTGKSTLLKLVLNELKPVGGNIRVGQNTVFNYIDQNRFLLDEDKTVMEEATDGKEYVMLGDHKLSAWTYVKRFLFTDEQIRQSVKQLSGGEKNRLLLAKMIKYGGNFLILDEPTNDLDLATLRILEEAIENFPGCVMVVSHDRYFLNRICTHTLAFEGDGRYFLNDGNYDYYLEKKKQLEATRKTAVVKKEKVVEKPKKKGLSWAEKKEFETIEDDIMTAETTVEEIETTMAASDFYEKYGSELQSFTRSLEEAKEKVAHLYDRWDYLNEKSVN